MVSGIVIKKSSLSRLLDRLWAVDIRITALTRRIIFFNIIGLFVLIGVVMAVYLPRFKEQMITQRTEFLQEHGELIALIVAEAAGRADPNGIMSYDPLAANQVLRRIVSDVGGRAQLYDRTGRLTADTRNIFGVIEPIEAQVLPKQTTMIERGFNRLSRKAEQMFSPTYPMYRETTEGGITETDEVYRALDGWVAKAVRENSSQDLIVSVAVPVQKFKAVMGALVLSTDSGDIDAIVAETRQRIFELFGVILLVSIIVSILVAYTIAYPIVRLTRAAGTTNPQQQRITIPDMKNRGDEIGELSTSLRTMTQAFYARIDAIESFAADVAHEIKNPLTSLRSAVESMRIVKNDSDKEQLMQVIEQDVTRMDRLLTDISNASRLDAELVRDKAEAFDLAGLLQSIVAMKDANITLTLHQDTLLIEGMQSRLAQVFQNIIDNAVSFVRLADPAQITIQTKPMTDGVCMTISDTGPGIPPEALERIFERFYSARPAEEQFGQHSGLGLSICKQIITAHSGTIWAENIDPQGARFCIILPSTQSDKAVL